MPYLAKIILYPVKSLAGVNAETAIVLGSVTVLTPASVALSPLVIPI
jgi:hypothetical protein